MGAAVWTYKAVDGAGVPSKGELKGPSKDAVTEQLQAQGLKIMELAREEVARSRPTSRSSSASRPPS